MTEKLFLKFCIEEKRVPVSIEFYPLEDRIVLEFESCDEGLTLEEEPNTWFTTAELKKFIEEYDVDPYQILSVAWDTEFYFHFGNAKELVTSLVGNKNVDRLSQIATLAWDYLTFATLTYDEFDGTESKSLFISVEKRIPPEILKELSSLFTNPQIFEDDEINIEEN